MVGVNDTLLQENEGFGVIMKNFNHERWGFVVQERRVERSGEQRTDWAPMALGQRRLASVVCSWKSQGPRAVSSKASGL